MNNLTTAKCNRCGGSATADSFEKAKLLIDHAVGLSRNLPCGDSYNAVVELTENKPKTSSASDKKGESTATKTTSDKTTVQTSKPTKK